jgi:hypothetical protein
MVFKLARVDFLDGPAGLRAFGYPLSGHHSREWPGVWLHFRPNMASAYFCERIFP